MIGRAPETKVVKTCGSHVTRLQASDESASGTRVLGLLRDNPIVVLWRKSNAATTSGPSYSRSGTDGVQHAWCVGGTAGVGCDGCGVISLSHPVPLQQTV